jgi:quercetin dioxygenase-like cupin family protein
MEKQLPRPTVKGPADWFTGHVFIDLVATGHGSDAMSVGKVRFTPGARTAWHAHGIGQTLHVMEGEGRVQSRGEAVTRLRPGDVVFTPGGEWHWHGAAPDHFMMHLAVSEGDADWGEHVTDEDYSADPTD